MYLSPIIAVLALTVISTVQAADPTGCVHEGKTYPVGVEMDVPGKCILSTCAPEGHWTGKSCPKAPHLKGKVDYSKPYPDCCPNN